MDQCSRYRGLIATLGGRALALAEADVASSTAAVDARLGLPAARVLLADAIDPGAAAANSPWRAALHALAELGRGAQPADAPVRLCSVTGQWRDVYHPLVVHLYLRSFARVRLLLADAERAECMADLADAVRPLRAGLGAAGTVSLALWRCACVLERAHLDDRMEPGPAVAAAARWIDRSFDDRTPPAALHAHDPDEPLDFWTYRELAALHALGRLALREPRPAWRERIAEVTAFHQQHTQPDYTTYEPWALFAFAGQPETVWFADQQLHDAETHMHQAGGGRVMVALLLAEAADALACEPAS